MKTVAILGATGSVGRQALDVAEARGYSVDLISANSSCESVEAIARKFKPKYLAMGSPDAARSLSLSLSDTDIKVFSGEEGICEAISESDAEVVINSIIGEAGLMPTLATISSGKRLALANKESLVIAGDIVMSLAAKHGTEIIPVDSEHSAIFQSLRSGKRDEIKRLWLTASGGPFFGRTKEELSSVTLEKTLAHPTWKMGKKITVDSATLMNKGFEIVEAAHLFGVSTENIRVLIHRESILHSAVEYIDNSVIAELSVPDMRMCVQYAVDYPCRMPSRSEELDLFRLGSLTFREPDKEAFPLLSLAARAHSLGGGMCAVMNAADEVAVSAFLDKRIGFLDIQRVIIATFEKMLDARRATSLTDIIEADRSARSLAVSLIKEIEY
ncbi:MAG: 1-deoxy-D-xylulose-5-phosphate reductoisomerase [Ruminococcaceae bacterium]|nr:1-deoxy-D-xylulose-5-phosphate reductoisomerase [Oscillospiraceae bacterium]